MKRLYVFRLDGAKANDGYFERRKGGAERGGAGGYQGMIMSVGARWRPDGVEVEMSEDGWTALVTLVELEANAVDAMTSCRKYLPESGAGIMRQFLRYLSAVVRQCRKTGDPRLAEIGELNDVLRGGVKVVVRTAGALRTETRYCDVHTLSRQRERVNKSTRSENAIEVKFRLSGVHALSRRETDDLRRTVRVLHAVMTGDADETSLPAGCPGRRPWMRPLDSALKAEPNRYPALHRLIRRYSWSGRKVNCDQVAEELAGLWTAAGRQKWTAERAAQAVERFWGAAIAFSNDESMRVPFAEARRALKEGGWKEKREGRRAA